MAARKTKEEEPGKSDSSDGTPEDGRSRGSATWLPRPRAASVQNGLLAQPPHGPVPTACSLSRPWKPRSARNPTMVRRHFIQEKPKTSSAFRPDSRLVPQTQWFTSRCKARKQRNACFLVVQDTALRLGGRTGPQAWNVLSHSDLRAHLHLLIPWGPSVWVSNHC